MGSPRADASARNNTLLVMYLLTFVHQTKVLCDEYKVGDLDAWGIPTSAKPEVYAQWSKYHNLKIGDSLLFLYPPSQDSVIQVTEESYQSCNLKDPILYMNNGNSLFNITSNGEFYFTSGVAGHCEKKQKLHISVGEGNGIAPSDAPTAALPENANAPSYPTVFGSIPVSASSLSSSALPLLIPALLGFALSLSH